jgi:prolyl 4-hydroxylase
MQFTFLIVALVSSAIINVDQDVDEEWPLEVYDRFGNAVNITMEPGTYE